MNKSDKIKDICRKYPNICLSIHEWADIFFNSGNTGLKTTTDMDDRQLGYYGNIFNCKIFVSKMVASNNIRISTRENCSTKNMDDWSPEINLELDVSDIEKYLNLLAFW